MGIGDYEIPGETLGMRESLVVFVISGALQKSKHGHNWNYTHQNLPRLVDGTQDNCFLQ